MLGKITVAAVRFILNRVNLSIRDRSELFTAVLTKIVALPLRDIISYNDEGNLLVNGQALEMARALQLRDSAKGALENQAHKIAYEQILYKALEAAAFKTGNPDDLYFYRAAIWWGQEEVKILNVLAGYDQERDLTP